MERQQKLLQRKTLIARKKYKIRLLYNLFQKEK